MCIDQAQGTRSHGGTKPELRLADEVQALDRLAPPIGVRWVRHFPDVVQQGLPFARTAALLNQLDGGQTVNLSRNCQVRATTWRSGAAFPKLP